MGLCRFKKIVGTGEQKSGVFILGVQDMITFGSPPPALEPPHVQIFV